MRPLKLSTMNKAIWILLGLASLLVLERAFTLSKAVEAVEKAVIREKEAQRLGDSMQDASDRLTASARSFCVTQEKEYLHDYWNEAEGERRRDKAIENLSKLGLSAAEGDLLREAKAHSDLLMELEIRAMGLVAAALGYAEEELPPAMRSARSEDAALGRETKLDLARRLVFSTEYAVSKRRIQEDIGAFRASAQARLERDTLLAQGESSRAFITLVVAFGVSLLAGLASSLVYSALVSEPLQAYTELLNSPDAATDLPELPALGCAELRKLAAAYNERRDERSRAEAALRDSELKLLAHIEGLPLPAIEQSSDRKVVIWNPAAERVFGFSKEEALGKDIVELLVPEEERESIGALLRLLSAGQAIERNTNRNIRKDGAIITCEWHNTTLVDSRGEVQGWVSIAQDVTERERKNEEVLYLSNHDPLTGLANRRRMNELFHAESLRFERYGIPYSLIMLDVDLFKKFNDENGHDCGDLVLRSVADTIKRSVRATDATGRWGGEEFVILLPGTGKEGARVLAEKIRTAIEELRVSYQDRELSVTVTAGYAEAGGAGFEDCLHRADSALLSGKAAGRNRSVGADQR